jgi:hypothetical protein
MFVYNPDGFRPEQHLPPALAHYGDCARVLVHFIEQGRIRQNLGDGDFVPRKAAYLRKLVHPVHFEAIRDALVRGAVIEVDRRFTPGLRSFGYRIGPTFAATPFRRVKLTDPAAVARLKAARDDLRPPITHPVHKRLWAWLQKVEIEYEAALRHLDGLGERPEAVCQLALTVEMIHDQEFYFSTDERGRTYTNVTSLKGDLRQFLRIDGRRLAGVDVGNSQPLFFGAVVLDKVRQKSQRRSPSTSVPLSPPPSPSLYDACIGPNACELRDFPPDVVEYVRLCEAKRFYERMMEATGADKTMSREAFKPHFFETLFYARRQSAKYAAEFRRLFPTVFEVLSGLRERDHRQAALRLQEMEAAFVYKSVCRRILKDAPAVPLLTIHNAVVTTEDHAGYVRQVMAEEFGRLGLRPTLDVEPFSPPDCTPRPSAKLPDRKRERKKGAARTGPPHIRTNLNVATGGLIPLDLPCEIYPDQTGTGFHLLKFPCLTPDQLSAVPADLRPQIASWVTWQSITLQVPLPPRVRFTDISGDDL